MISERDLRGLPTDPTAAFLIIEERLRKEFEDHEELSKSAPVLVYSRYMNGVLAAANALGVDILSEFKELKSASQLRDKYPDFALIVDRFIIENRIKAVKRERDFSVALDPPTKAKIRHFINQIRETVDRLDLPPEKKDVIHRKVAALQLEIDRSRTQLQIAMDASLVVADTAGTVGRKLNPVRKLLGNISALLSRAREAEIQAALPPPQARLPAPDSEQPSN